MVALGTALALPCVRAVGRVVEAQLDGVTAVDAPTIAGASLLLALVALAAAMVPAWRAATISPTEALLRYHFDRRVEDLRAEGRGEDDARKQAAIEMGRNRAGPGRRAGDLDLALARRRRQGRPLRRAQPRAEPGIHDHRRRVAGHRHRGQRGDLLAPGPGAPPPPARAGAAAARPRRLEGQRARARAGQRCRFQPDVVSDLPRPAGAGPVLRRALPPPDGGEPGRRGGADAGAGRDRDRLRLVFPGARGEPGAWPPL